MLQEDYSKTIAVIWSSCCIQKAVSHRTSCNLRSASHDFLGGGLHQPSEAMGGEAFGTGKPFYQGTFTPGALFAPKPFTPQAGCKAPKEYTQFSQPWTKHSKIMNMLHHWRFLGFALSSSMLFPLGTFRPKRATFMACGLKAQAVAKCMPTSGKAIPCTDILAVCVYIQNTVI